MPSRSKNQRKNRRPKNKGLLHQSSPYAHKALSAPAHAPQFPTEASVALHYFDTNWVSTGIQQRIIVPLVEMLGLKPQKLDQYFGMYTFYKLTAVAVKMSFCSASGGNPFVVVGGVLPYAGATSVSQFDLANIAGAKCRAVPMAAETRMNWDLPTEKYLGNVFQTSQFWIDQAQSASTSPVSQEEPVFCLVVQHPSGKEMQYVYDLRVTFHCEFFNPLVKF
jgi:hypothetical protein